MEGAAIATGLGVNSELIKAISSTINLNPVLTTVLAVVISSAITIFTFVIVYDSGGKKGLIAVTLGLLAGILIYSSNQIFLFMSLIFLVSGILLGKDSEWR